MANFSKVRRTFLRLTALVLLTGCQSFFYMPTQQKLFDPARISMKEEDIFVTTPSGKKIHAWYFASTQKESKGTVVFFHGNAENLSSHFLMLRWLPENGYSYLVFDYPGYGISSGSPTPESTVEAGVAVINWVHANKDSAPLIVYAHSLGGAIALKSVEFTKASVPFRCVVIDGSFSSYGGMSRRILKRQWWTWWLQPVTYISVSDKFSPEPLSQLAPIPVLFVHGTGDPVIEPASSQEMYNAALQPKELWLVPGHHGDLYEMNNGELRPRLLQYFEKHSTSSLTAHPPVR